MLQYNYGGDILKGYIYKFQNKTNGKVYIGQTVNLEQRYKDHIYYAKNNPQQPIHYALAKYGEYNFSFDVVTEIECDDNLMLELILNDLEKKYIEEYDSYAKGYNCSLGGEGNLGLVHSDETKQLIGHRSRDRSAESNKKISEANKRRVYTQEEKARLADNLAKNARPAASEWHKSEEGRKKHSELMQGKNYRPLLQHICLECGEVYHGYGKKDRYCSGACEQRAYRKKRKEANK